MALLTPEEEDARAEDSWPFSNGFEFDSWASIWCLECAHYATCPLLLVMLMGKTPAAWEQVDPGALNRYHCHEFLRKDPPDEAQEVQEGQAGP